MIGKHALESGSDLAVKRTVSLKPREVLLLDSNKQLDIMKRFENEEDPAEVYKQMLMEAWSVQDIKCQPSKSERDIGVPQPYEVIVHPSKREELPIVGYAPIYAKRFIPEKTEEVRQGEATQEEPIRPKELPKELIDSKTSQMFLKFIEEINAKATYVTPFDKFVPHEALLPELQPSVAAELLASGDIDPVRGSARTEEEAIEAQLNLPDFDQVMGSNDDVKRKIRENMRLWQSISNHIPAQPPTQEDLKLLDYATLCNMYMGYFGMDEDSMMLQFFYKFQYDDAWRERIKTGCFSVLDECNNHNCGICPVVTDKDMATMKDGNFFEIEDKDDYKNVVVRIREEYNRKNDDETNWEFMQLIKNPVDSDLDSDGFVSDDDLVLCKEKRPSSKDWIRAKGTWVAPAKFDVPPPDEEDQRPCDVTCEDVEILKFRDIITKKDTETLEKETVELMKKKLDRKRADERKGIHWRAKSNYLYRWPDFRKKANK